MLSKRLNSLVKYIDYNDSVIDIGCDHALLDIHLVSNNIIPNLIVSDIHDQALASGVSNIKKAGLNNKIDARLGNGLEVLDEKDNINTVLISGMGTSTILAILKSPYLNNIKKLVIQSNNNHEELRKVITSLGFFIEAEEYFIDKKKNYINIVFKRGKKNYTKDELRYGPFLIKNIDYLKFELNNCLKIKNLIKDSKLKQKISLNLEIIKIKKYIKRCE